MIWRKGLVFILIFLFIGTALGHSIGTPPTEPYNKDRSEAYYTNSHDLPDAWIKILMKLSQCPSLSMCIIKNDSVVLYKSYGYYNIKEKLVPQNNTIYLISSITKTVLTTALLQLYEHGCFDLDEDVNTYLPFSLRHPQYPEYPITFEMLLNHRAGIYDFCFFELKGLPSFLKWYPPPDDLGPWLYEVLVSDDNEKKSDYWLDYAPGSKMRYSNIGFLVLGYLFEILSNQSLEEYCQEHIFSPLNMKNTSFHLDRLDVSHIATPYIHRFGCYIPLPYIDFRGFAVMAGIRTTIEDLSHFLIAHINNGVYKEVRILEEETIHRMHTTKKVEDEHPQLNDTYRGYGLGWISLEKFGRRIEGHGGFCPGAGCQMFMNETDRIGYIIFSNQLDILGFFEPVKFKLKTKTLYLIGSLLLEKAEMF